MSVATKKKEKGEKWWEEDDMQALAPREEPITRLELGLR